MLENIMICEPKLKIGQQHGLLAYILKYILKYLFRKLRYHTVPKRFVLDPEIFKINSSS